MCQKFSNYYKINLYQEYPIAKSGFKIVLLQKFYNLSDVRVENELKVNLLYIKFVGLSLEDATPDSTTIGRFRNSLINNNITCKNNFFIRKIYY